MKQNITLSLDPDLLRGARVLAAQRGTSVSKLLAAELERLGRDDQAYDRAREQALNHLDQGLHLSSMSTSPGRSPRRCSRRRHAR